METFTRQKTTSSIPLFPTLLFLGVLLAFAPTEPNTAATQTPQDMVAPDSVLHTRFIHSPSGVKFLITVGISEPVDEIWQIIPVTITPTFKGLLLGPIHAVRTVRTYDTDPLLFSVKDGYAVGAALAESKLTLKSGSVPSPDWSTPPVDISISRIGKHKWENVLVAVDEKD